MADLDRRYFKRPLLAIALILFLIIPAIISGMIYTYRPTMLLDNKPRLLFGKSSNMPTKPATRIIGKAATPFTLHQSALGYDSPVSVDNALVAYAPRELFAASINPNQIMWFGVVCPLTDLEADAYEAALTAEATATGTPIPSWVRDRPLYSFDCTRDYPYGFDFTVMAKLPMFHMQQFRMEMWSGRETPMRGVRQLVHNMSIADYANPSKTNAKYYRNSDQQYTTIDKALPAGSSNGNSVVGTSGSSGTSGTSGSSSASQQQGGGGSSYAFDIDLEPLYESRYSKNHNNDNTNTNNNADGQLFPSAAPAVVQQQQHAPFAPLAAAAESDANARAAAPAGAAAAASAADRKDAVVGNYVSPQAVANTEVIKTCDKITDECVQASMFTYTRSYKLMYPQSRGVGYNGRLVIQQPGTDGIWQMSISSDLGKIVAEIDISVIAEPAVGTRSFYFRLFAGLLCLAVFLLLFIVVKVVGLYIRLNDTTRIFSVIDPSHDDIVHEGWEDARSLWQYWTFKASEARSRWAHARRRRLRSAGASTPNQTDSLTASTTSNIPSADENGAPLTPTSVLAAKAKASQAAGAPVGGYPSSSEEEGDVCRICRVGEPASDLVAPCACAGTSRYVHRACLEQWRSMTSNPEHRRICAECKTEYNVEQAVPQRSVGEKLLRLLSPIIKIGLVVSSFLLFGFLIKGMAALITADPHIDWSMNFYHIFIGSLALCSIMIVFSNGLWFVIDFPKTLLHRVPAIVFLGIAGPILLGYMSQFWCAILFETVITPEVSFGAGVFTFVAFINNALIKLAEVLTPQLEPTRRRLQNAHAAAEEGEATPEAGPAAQSRSGSTGTTASAAPSPNAAAAAAATSASGGPSVRSSPTAIVVIPSDELPETAPSAANDGTATAAVASPVVSSGAASSVSISIGGGGAAARAGINRSADEGEEMAPSPNTPAGMGVVSPARAAANSAPAVAGPLDELLEEGIDRSHSNVVSGAAAAADAAV